MELKEKIGQLLIVGFHGAFPEDEGVQLLSAQIKQSAVGGIIQYGYNITAPDQVKTLNKHFLDVAEQAKLPPLFTTVDQEGGKVQRLLPKKGFQGFPSSEEILEARTSEMAFVILFPQLPLKQVNNLCCCCCCCCC